MSENKHLKFTGGGSLDSLWQADYKREWSRILDRGLAVDDNGTAGPSPLESVKTAILALSEPDQRNVYAFMYALGPRINS